MIAAHYYVLFALFICKNVAFESFKFFELYLLNYTSINSNVCTLSSFPFHSEVFFLFSQSQLIRLSRDLSIYSGHVLQISPHTIYAGFSNLREIPLCFQVVKKKVGQRVVIMITMLYSPSEQP